ncbi:MAG: transketolase [Anaerolineaceae bacterium]|nr:transketolase [Anaerolineaceae bacterium]
MDPTLLQIKSLEYRKGVIELIKNTGAGHTGGSLSSVDILNVLYNHTLNVSPETFLSPNRDRYIQSKGHSVEALYIVLADKGFFPREALNTVERYQSPYIGHPTRDVNGIEQNTGALGHGLAVAVGMALAAKLDKRPYRVFTLLGDGELSEGSNWEALMAAAHYKLDNLVVIVDRNKLQITGRTDDINAVEPLADKFRAFGMAVCECDGNSTSDLSAVFDQLPFEPMKPNLIIAHTVKGKGISFMEDAVQWHHKVPNDDEYAIALQELDTAIAELKAHVHGSQ